MFKKSKRIISVLLTVIMMLSVVPFTINSSALPLTDAQIAQNFRATLPLTASMANTPTWTKTVDSYSGSDSYHVDASLWLSQSGLSGTGGRAMFKSSVITGYNTPQEVIYVNLAVYGVNSAYSKHSGFFSWRRSGTLIQQERLTSADTATVGCVILSLSGQVIYWRSVTCNMYDYINWGTPTFSTIAGTTFTF